MKTIVIWNQIDAELKYFVIEGDYSDLDDVYINALTCNDEKQDRLTELVYGEEGELKVTMEKQFPRKVIFDCIREQEVFHIIQCGIIP